MVTKQDILIKWTAYTFATLLLLLLRELTRSVTLFGVAPLLPPILVGAVASLEEYRYSAYYALLLGVLCDLALPVPFPCLYTVSFSLAVFLSCYLAEHVMQPGFFSALVSSVAAFLFVDLFRFLALLPVTKPVLLTFALLAVRELPVSLLLLPLCYPLLRAVHRRFTL